MGAGVVGDIFHRDDFAALEVVDERAVVAEAVRASDRGIACRAPVRLHLDGLPPCVDQPITLPWWPGIPSKDLGGGLVEGSHAVEITEAIAQFEKRVATRVRLRYVR